MRRNYYSAAAIFLGNSIFLVSCFWIMTNTLWTFSYTTLAAVALLFAAVFYILKKEWQQLTLLKKFCAFFMNSISLLFISLALLYLVLQLFIHLMGGADYLLTTRSPDRHYSIDFYAFDAGAMGSFGIRGELDGPFGFKKQIYYEKHAEKVDVQWLTNDIIRINGHELHLKNGDTFGYRIYIRKEDDDANRTYF